MSLVVAKDVGADFFGAANLCDAATAFVDILSLFSFVRAATEAESPCSSSRLEFSSSPGPPSPPAYELKD